MSRSGLKSFDRYLLGEVLREGLRVIAIGTLLLCVARLVIILHVAIERQGSLMLIAGLLVSFLPHYVSFLLPFSVFWSILMVARRLQKSSELSVLAASGTSWWRVFRPLFAVGLVAGITNLALLGWIEPHARYSYRSLMYELKTVAVYQLIKAGQFTVAGKHTIFVNEVERRSNRFRGIFIFERENDGSRISILAPEGQILRKDDAAVIELYDGTRQRFIPNSNIPENLEFQSMRVPLDGPLMKFRPRGDDEQELSLTDIYAGFAHPPSGVSLVDMKTEFHSKLVVILSSLFLPMAGLGFALFSGRRERVFALALPVIYIASLFQALQFGDVLIQKYRFWPVAYFWTVFWVYAIVALLLLIWKNDLAAIWGARRWRFRSD